MIREATREDRFAIIRMVRNFYNAYKQDFPVMFDSVYAERAIKKYISLDDHLILVFDTEGAGIQGVLIAHAYWHEMFPIKFARELIWWVEPDYRAKESLKLVKYYESWAIGLGCNVIGLANIDRSDPRINIVLKRMGYQAVEKYWAKEV